MEVKISDVKALIDANLKVRIAMKQYVQRKIREDKLDVTYEMLQVLTVLWNGGDSNQQEIADKVQKNKASMTSLLDNLSKRNLITRTEDPIDRRNKIISLTIAGSEFEKQMQPLLHSFYQVLQTGLNAEEIKHMTAQLVHLHQNLMR